MNIFEQTEYLKDKPSTVNNIHESIYRSYDVVAIVFEMLNENVPNKVIKDFISYYYNMKQNDKTIK
jgi:hypothetical protein